MVVVRSVRISMCTAGGRVAWSCGRSARTRSTTAMTLAPGWRWMLTITAGVSFLHAACSTFSTSSTTSATSSGRTGAPLRCATVSGLYSAPVRGEVAGGGEGEGRAGPVARPLRRFRVGGRDAGPRPPGAEAVGRRRRGVRAPAARGARPPADAYQADTGQLGDLLHEPRLR